MKLLPPIGGVTEAGVDSVAVSKSCENHGHARACAVGVARGEGAAGGSAAAGGGSDFAQAADGVHALLHDATGGICGLRHFAREIVLVLRRVGRAVDDFLQLGHLPKIVVRVILRAHAISHRREPPIVVLRRTRAVPQRHAGRRWDACGPDHVVTHVRQPVQRVVGVRGDHAARIGSLRHQIEVVVLERRLACFRGCSAGQPSQIVVSIRARLRPLRHSNQVIQHIVGVGRGHFRLRTSGQRRARNRNAKGRSRKQARLIGRAGLRERIVC